MNDRWPATLAMTVCSLALLSAGVAAFMALAFASQPVALSFGGLGLVAAFMGLFAIIQWVRQAEETYPDYRYYRALQAKGRLADRVLEAANQDGPERAPEQAPEKAIEAPPLRGVVNYHTQAAEAFEAPRISGGNVVMFDPARARRNRIRPL
jgi:hypothetical protein